VGARPTSITPASIHQNYRRLSKPTQARRAAKNSRYYLVRFKETYWRFAGFIFMMNETHDKILVPGSNPDPSSPDHAPIKSTTHARAGVTFGTMRWVLGISMIAVVIVFGAIWLSAHH
jgi:hypothetical protein